MSLTAPDTDFVTVVFDTSDRISHMFYRTLDPTHPANAGKEVERWKSVIPDTYAKMDELIGEVRAKIGDDRQKALAELQRVTTEIEQAKKEIADIEEDARKANIPPGWIR